MNTDSRPAAGSSLDDRRWRQVAARDRAAAGAFVYAVTSTGVFCRPGCPSRRPRRDRVRFFDTPAAASTAGFRPCLRCRPTGSASAAPGADAVERAAAFLAAHADEPVTLSRLAARARMSPAHLQRRFTALLGVSPREYQAACRAARFRRELRAGRDVTAAIYEAGYGSPSRVYESAPTGRGVSPAAYRKGAPGHEVGYTIVDCGLGRLLVAATPKGVCAVKLGGSDKLLEAELRRELPAATITEGGIVSRPWVEAIVALAEGREEAVSSGSSATLPLDVRGTAFQWRVWRALMRIPAGETLSYSEVARAIGRPTAVRAVARACASNPVCLVVPCHRVIGKDGSLGGYRWGVKRKAQLIRSERKAK